MEPRFPQVYSWPTVFYVDGKELHREDGLIFLNKGDGYIGGDQGQVDTWFSFDHRGAFDLGLHVFLERVDAGSEEDRPGRLEPNYFSG
jgi:hypothetical protein